MDALVVSAREPGRIRLVHDHPKPTPRPGEVLIEVVRAGVCSTDLEIVRGYMGFSGVPGHEFVGTVIEGPPDLKGQRVVSEINCACGKCDLCRRGMPTHCRRRSVIGILNHDGAFATHVVAPAINCHIVPDEIDDDAAVFVEPVAAAVQVVRHCAVEPRMRVAVLGSGRLGLLCAQVLARYHANVLVVGRNPHSLALAEGFGLDARGAKEVQPTADNDIVVECTGNPDGLRLALQMVRPRGVLVLKSTYAEPQAVDLAPIVINEVRVLGNRCGPFPDAIELLQKGRIQVQPLISDRFPLADGVAAFKRAAERDAMKVLIDPQTTTKDASCKRG